MLLHVVMTGVLRRASGLWAGALKTHPNPSAFTSLREAIVERRRTGNILEKGSTGSRPGRGGGSWGELPWASVLGWDPHWSEQLEWNVPGIKRLPLLHISPYGVPRGKHWGEKGDCSGMPDMAMLWTSKGPHCPGALSWQPLLPDCSYSILTVSLED